MQRAELVDDVLHAFVDRDQRGQGVLVVDAIGVDFAGAQVGRFADEAGLVVDVALVEPFGAAVRVGRPGEGVVVAGCRLRPGGAAEIAVRGGVVELQVKGLFGRGLGQLLPGERVEEVGLVEARFAVQRRARAAEVVAFAVLARLPATGIAVGALEGAVVVERVAVEVVVGVGAQDAVPRLCLRRTVRRRSR